MEHTKDACARLLAHIAELEQWSAATRRRMETLSIPQAQIDATLAEVEELCGLNAMRQEAAAAGHAQERPAAA